MTRNCDICSGEFVPKVHNSLRCSPACVRKYRSNWMNAHHIKAPIRTLGCVRCGTSVELKPKANQSKCHCEACRTIIKQEANFRHNNSEAALKSRKKYSVSEKRYEYKKRWYAENRQSIYAKRNSKRANSPELRTIESLRSRLNAFVKRKKSVSTYTLLGCSPSDLRAHLESQFKEGMSWENYGRTGWHIDHIVPLSSFQFYNADGSENLDAFQKSMHYTNLQPLWAWENISKGDTLLISQ